MERIEVNVITGEQKTIPLTAEEIAELLEFAMEWFGESAEGAKEYVETITV